MYFTYWTIAMVLVIFATSVAFASPSMRPMNLDRRGWPVSGESGELADHKLEPNQLMPGPGASGCLAAR